MSEPSRESVAIEEVAVTPLALERLVEVLSAEQQEELQRTVTRGEQLLAGRVVWNVNSTARGGGVAEMLQSLIAYARAGGVDARWMVLAGEADFFRVTKRIHNRLHGSAGDGGPLGDEERAIYEATSRAAADALSELVRPGDVILLHDPQTAGLAGPLGERGAHVIWRAHVGIDHPNDHAREAWAFLLPYVSVASAYVFSRRAYAWEGLDRERVVTIAPSIDPLSTKNQQLEAASVRAILQAAGLLTGRGDGMPTFHRQDGSPGRIDRRAELVEEVTLPEDAQVVAQVSRWDHLKDPLGVLDAFVEHVAPRSGAHLVLAGPDTSAVADDPEGADTVRACAERWEALGADVRARIHLAQLPMVDAEENAAMVNALQRWSTVISQKSVAEGFGLTVTEAMWKGRPVVAGRVGGIQDQIADGSTGLLVDPEDLQAFGAAVVGLLLDPERADRMGTAAREVVRNEFLGVRHLRQYVDLFERLIEGSLRGGSRTSTVDRRGSTS